MYIVKCPGAYICDYWEGVSLESHAWLTSTSRPGAARICVSAREPGERPLARARTQPLLLPTAIPVDDSAVPCSLYCRRPCYPSHVLHYTVLGKPVSLTVVCHVGPDGAEMASRPRRSCQHHLRRTGVRLLAQSRRSGLTPYHVVPREMRTECVDPMAHGRELVRRLAAWARRSVFIISSIACRSRAPTCGSRSA